MTAQSFTYSGNVYTGAAAGTVDFALTSTAGNPILYLESAHIHVYKSTDQGDNWTELTRPSQWDFVSSGTVARLVTGVSAGDWVKVQRITPSTSSYVTFQASSLLTAEQLNDDTLFNTYLNQERFDQGEQSSLAADDAKTAADAATAAATAATTAANTATSTANTALSTANAASSTATQAATDAAAAVLTANQASTDATAAVSAANTANTNASNAVTTANAADAKADQAISAVSTAILYDLVANVASIPASPANNDAVEVFNSTGIESFTPLAGVPGGFVGSSGLSVRMVYSTAGSTWNWVQYFPNDPETRYLKFGGGTLTGQLRGDNAGSAVAPDFAFDGDPDTGLYSPGANELGLATGGVTRLTFDSAGAATFTGSVTLPAGSTVAGYLDTATAASTYQTQAGMSSYVATADIGVTVQGYDATTLKSADIGVTVQGYDATTLKSADIGTTVQAYDADTAKLDVAQTFTAQQTFGELKETVYTLSGTAIDPANGSIQTKTLSANTTFTDSLEAGQTVVLMLEGGATYTVTWPTITWVTSGGNAAPTLTAKDTLVLWKVSTTLYGAYVGSYV